LENYQKYGILVTFPSSSMEYSSFPLFILAMMLTIKSKIKMKISVALLNGSDKCVFPCLVVLLKALSWFDLFA
jgi:hypothetical protein